MIFTDLLTRYKKIDEYFNQKFPVISGDVKILARLGKITEELGELNSEVHGKLQWHRQEKQAEFKDENLAKEWADVFNTVILFGMSMDIDMPKAIDERLKEIYRRYGLK